VPRHRSRVRLTGRTAAILNLCMQSAQSIVIYILVGLAVAAEVAVFVRLAGNRLWSGRYIFCAMLLLSLARLAFSLTGNLHPYREFWQATQRPLAGLEAGAAIEAFWVL